MSSCVHLGAGDEGRGADDMAARHRHQVGRVHRPQLEAHQHLQSRYYFWVDMIIMSLQTAPEPGGLRGTEGCSDPLKLARCMPGAHMTAACHRVWHAHLWIAHQNSAVQGEELTPR